MNSPMLAGVAGALAALALMSPATRATDAATPSPATLTAHEQRIEALRTDAGIVGLAAAIIVDDKVVWRRGYGHADRATGRPFTPATPMGVASISKTFVGAAMLRAVEQGRLDLDVDIGRWLPFDVANPHRPDAVITLRHLATHTSGIVDRAEVYAGTYHYGDAEPEPLARFLQDYLARGGGRHAEANFVDADPGT